MANSASMMSYESSGCSVAKNCEIEKIKNKKKKKDSVYLEDLKDIGLEKSEDLEESGDLKDLEFSIFRRFIKI